MKKIFVITILISICFITLLYFQVFIPHKSNIWKINTSEVKSINLNGHMIKDNQIYEIVDAFNSIYNIKQRNNSEGSTPEFTMVIYLNSGLEIDIQDISKDYFIIDKVNKKKLKSYCANSNNLYSLMKEIQAKNYINKDNFVPLK